MMRRDQLAQSRVSQPDPYDGSYNLADPQSFNRYSYVQNDPVNFVDPSGLLRVQQCRIDWMMINGEKVYGAPYNCQTIHDDEGGGQTSVVPLPDVRAGVRAVLNDQACAAFVTNLLRAVESNGNPAQTTSGSGLVSMTSGFVFGPQTSGGGDPIGGTISGYANQNNARVHISPTIVSSLAGEGVRQEAQLGYIMVGLHDLILTTAATTSPILSH